MPQGQFLPLGAARPSLSCWRGRLEKISPWFSLELGLSYKAAGQSTNDNNFTHATNEGCTTFLTSVNPFLGANHSSSRNHQDP
eukprot:769102-Amphidinium_carterae.1